MLFTDGPDQKGGDHGAVHAAGKGQEHLAVAHLGADGFHLIVDEVFHVPVRLRAAGLEYELPDMGLRLLP